MLDSPPLKKPTSPFWKVFIRSFLLLLLLLFILLCFAPTFLSTGWGTQLLVQFLNKKIEGKIQIQQTSLSWLGHQEIVGISYADTEKQITATCDKVTSDASLFSILFGAHYLGDFTIEHPDVKIKKELISYKSLPHSLPKYNKASLVVIPSLDAFLQNNFFPVTGRFTINNGSIEMINTGVDPITINNIQSTLFLAKDRSQISLTLLATTSEQSETGELQFEGLFQDLKSQNPSFTIKTNISHLPVKGLDQILSIFNPHCKGLLLEAIGPSLTITLEAALSKQNLDVSLLASSQNFKANLQTQTAQNTISLKSPAVFSLSVLPSFANKLLAQGFQIPSIALINPTVLTWTIDRFSLPLAASQLDTSKLAFQSKLSSTPLQLGLKGADPLTISPLDIQLASKNLEQGVDVSLSSQLTSQGATAQLSLTGQITDVLTSVPRWQLSLKTQQFPSALIDAALSSGLYARAVLGKTLNADIQIQDQNAISCTITTPTLTLQNAQWKFTNQWELVKPFTLTLTPSPELYALLFPSKEVVPAASQPLQLRIESCKIPSQISQMQLQASLQTPLLSYQKMFLFSPYSLENLSAVISINTFDSIKLDLKSSLLSLSFEGAFNQKDQAFTFKKPITSTYLITDAQLGSLFTDVKQRPTLVKQALLEVHVDPITLPIAASLSELALKGNALIDELFLQAPDGAQQAIFKKSQIAFDFNGKKSLLGLKASSTFSDTKSPPGTLDAQIQARSFLQNGSWDSASLESSSHVTIQNLSSSFLQTLLAQKNALDTLLGPSLNLKLDIETSPQNRTVALEAKSLLLSMKGAASFDGNIFKLQGAPLDIQYTLTPEGYPFLDRFITGQQDQLRPFSLVESTTFSCLISDLYFPLLKVACTGQETPAELCFKADLSKLKLKGKLENKNLSFLEKQSKQTVALKNLVAEFSRDSETAPLVVKMNTQAFSSAGNPPSQEGTVALQAKFDHLFSTEGILDLSHLSSQVDITIQKLPSISLDVFSRFMGKTNAPFSTIFGPSLNATLQASIQDASGPIKLNVNSPNTRASLAGKLSKGLLTLSEPVYAQITMTPEMSSLFLQEVNPLGITSISSKSPITLEIAAEGFSVPIAPFDIAKVNIPKAQVELGKIHCKNEGNLNVALGLLKSAQASENNELPLWFAPIVFHVNQGVVDLERSEILVADTFDIALWGKLNLVQNQVDMILGLTAQCLQQAFGIKGLPEDYVLHVPMTGKTDDVKIDKGKATAKIAALLVWQQKSLAGDAVGGSAGALFNQFLNKLGSLPLNSEGTPPAKHPFPWEAADGPKKKDETERPKKKTHIKQKDKPLKQLFKIVK